MTTSAFLSMMLLSASATTRLAPGRPQTGASVTSASPLAEPTAFEELRTSVASASSNQHASTEIALLTLQRAGVGAWTIGSAANGELWAPVLIQSCLAVVFVLHGILQPELGKRLTSA